MSTVVAQTISNGTVSTSSANVIQGSAKAWVSVSGGSPSINASYNVSSVTRPQTGIYTINFSTAFADANYAINVSTLVGGASAYAFVGYANPSTTSCQVGSASKNLLNDAPSLNNNNVFVSIFR